MSVSLHVSSNAKRVLRDLHRIRPRAIGFAWDRAAWSAGQVLIGEVHRAYRAALPHKRFSGRGRNFPRVALYRQRRGRSRGGTLADVVVRSGSRKVGPQAEKILKRMVVGGLKHPHKSEYLWVPIRRGGKEATRPRNKDNLIVTKELYVIKKTGRGGKGREVIARLRRSTRDTGPAAGMRPRLRAVSRVLSVRFTRELRKEFAKAAARNRAGSRRF